MGTLGQPLKIASAAIRWETLLADVRAAAANVASARATEVDREGRFPHESLAAMRELRLLGAGVPTDLGGLGCSLSQLGAITQAFGQRCASSGMIFAMHQIQVGCLLRHGAASSFFRGYLSEICASQRLIASVTSEVGVGGDLRTSIAAVTPHDQGCRLEKDATTVSYGEQADDLLITCRRDPDAAGSDQILVLVRGAQARLHRTSGWDALGMRGTCSPGFKVAASFPREQVVPGDFGSIAAQTMVPWSHILWGFCWLGIATDAANRARAFVRNAARNFPGQTPAGAARLAHASQMLQAMRSSLVHATAEYEASSASPDGANVFSSMGFALRMNNLKIECSEALARIVHEALLVCGMAGYKNDTPFSLGRHLRDAHSAALMISNDRIRQTNAALLLVHKDD